MGSTVSIVMAVIAVVVGFLILNNINDDGTSPGGGIAVPVDSVDDTTVDSIVETTTTTTEPPLVTDGATVVVANASGVPGSAGRMTEELAGVGFVTATAANAARPTASAGARERMPSSQTAWRSSGTAGTSSQSACPAARTTPFETAGIGSSRCGRMCSNADSLRATTSSSRKRSCSTT